MENQAREKFEVKFGVKTFNIEIGEWFMYNNNIIQYITNDSFKKKTPKGYGRYASFNKSYYVVAKKHTRALLEKLEESPLFKKVKIIEENGSFRYYKYIRVK